MTKASCRQLAGILQSPLASGVERPPRLEIKTTKSKRHGGGASAATFPAAAPKSNHTRGGTSAAAVT